MEWLALMEALNAERLSWARRASSFSAAFWNPTGALSQEILLSSLEENAADYPVETTLAAVHTVRKYDALLAARIARRLAGYAPASHTIRYTLSDCLQHSPMIEDRLEAAKQRLLARGLHIQHLLQQPNGIVEANELRATHMQQLRALKASLTAKPSGTVGTEQIGKLGPARIALHLAARFIEIPDRAGLPPTERPAASVVVVVDTNAITHPATHALLKDWRADHIAPASVLLEIAAHGRIETIPWGFNYVKIRSDPQKIPPEIDHMFSRRKGRAPSRTDKTVAALALELGADAILTDDRDIWDTSVRYDLLKNTGRDVAIVRPADYARWLDRRVGGTAPR